MAKKSKSRAPKRKKPGRARLEIKIEVGQRKEPTVKDVELAIKKKLASKPTDLFRNRDKVVIVIEDEGGHKGPGRQ